MCRKWSKNYLVLETTKPALVHFLNMKDSNRVLISLPLLPNSFLAVASIDDWEIIDDSVALVVLSVELRSPIILLKP